MKEKIRRREKSVRESIVEMGKRRGDT